MDKAVVRGGVVVGVGMRPVTVTAERRAGVTSISGLPEQAAREARVRVRSALSSIDLDPTGVGVRIEPELTSGVGAQALDLPIALAILQVSGAVLGAPVDTAFGALTLAGRCETVRGILPLVEGAGPGRVLIPEPSARVASMGTWKDQQVLTVEYLRDALDGGSPIHATPPRGDIDDRLDASQLQDPSVLRALEIAAVGGHSLLLLGPPDSGKTWAARHLIGLLPAPDEAAARTIACCHDAAGLTDYQGRQRRVERPFRAPHHTVSEAGLLGGSNGARPGEVSLASEGVLMLDELLEFRGSTLAALAATLDRGYSEVSCGSERVRLPARAQLVGTCTRCACGRLGSSLPCLCDPRDRARWADRAAGAFAMFDLRVVVDPMSSGRCPTSAHVRERVAEARTRRSVWAPLEAGALAMLDRQSRAIRDRVLSMARTLAAVLGQTVIAEPTLADALTLVAGKL